MSDADWHLGAVCTQTDPEVFYARGQHLMAKRVCGQCPVMQECRTAALANEEEFGTWGGLSAPERLVILKGVHGPDYHWPIAPDTDPKTGWRGIWADDATTCVKGHDLTEDNIAVSADNVRRCRQCKRDADRESGERRRAKRRAERDAA